MTLALQHKVSRLWGREELFWEPDCLLVTKQITQLSITEL